MKLEGPVTHVTVKFPCTRCKGGRHVVAGFSAPCVFCNGSTLCEHDMPIAEFAALVMTHVPQTQNAAATREKGESNGG